MNDRAFYEFRAPKFVDFTSTFEGKSAYFDDVFNNSGGSMDIDITSPLPSDPNIRWSSTPNKRDSCTQTPNARTEEEESILSDALDTMLHLDAANNRRSVRFNDAVDVYPGTPNCSRVVETNAGDKADPNGNKRQTTPIQGQTWHQALKYRSVEHRVATPKPGGSRTNRGGLIADPTLKVGGAAQVPHSVPRMVHVKVRVDPKPAVVKVQPFKITSYKPKQSPLEDPVKFFQRDKDTPVRQTQTKAAVRRLPVAENAESPKTPLFRARPPVSLYQKPFAPKHVDRPPIKIEPFRLHTEERAKKREEYNHKIQQHLLELQEERQRLAAEREREIALQMKELRRVKIHARPVPSFVYSPVVPRVEKSPKTPLGLQRPKTSAETI